VHFVHDVVFVRMRTRGVGVGVGGAMVGEGRGGGGGGAGGGGGLEEDARMLARGGFGGSRVSVRVFGRLLMNQAEDLTSV
jgi:hypothetical protein